MGPWGQKIWKIVVLGVCERAVRSSGVFLTFAPRSQTRRVVRERSERSLPEPREPPSGTECLVSNLLRGRLQTNVAHRSTRATPKVTNSTLHDILIHIGTLTEIQIDSVHYESRSAKIVSICTEIHLCVSVYARGSIACAAVASCARGAPVGCAPSRARGSCHTHFDILRHG